MTHDGGPIASIGLGQISVFDRMQVQATARLDPRLGLHRELGLYSDADGTGTGAEPAVAIEAAISRALERWAYYATHRSGQRHRHGYDLDPSSNGIAAHPGLSRAEARRQALLEATARFCLIAWWERQLEAQWMQTDWPDVEAIVIRAPRGGFTVIVTRLVACGRRAYGYAAADSYSGACELAMVELARCAQVLAESCAAGRVPDATDLVERRLLHFSSPAGFAEVCARVGSPLAARPLPATLACDTEMAGPWSRYATVWRCLLFPPSLDFVRPVDDYFFW